MSQDLPGRGFRAKTEVVEDNRAASAITDFARKSGVEMIVIATHGCTGLKNGCRAARP